MSEIAIADWLATQQDAMVAMLREMVDIDSGSYNKPGIDAVGDVIRRFMASQNIPVETVAQQKHGDCLRALAPWDGPAGNAGGNILLMGHRDTVFPDGEAARRPFTIRDGLAYGPGVADMKAGLVMNCFVLAAFAKFGGAPAPLVCLFTGDEEIGSPEGRAVIETEARRARVVFNSEPGRVSGNVVTGRKGGVFMSFRITGKAAHSGANFSDGISAIEELARKIQAIHALTDLERGITLNVGLVSGGQSVNTVAPWSEGQIDLRYVEPAGPRRRDGADRRHHGTQLRAGHQDRNDRERRVPAADANADGETPVRTLCPGGGRYRLSNRRRIYRRLRGFRIYRRSGRSDDLRGRPGRRQGAQSGRVHADRQPRPARSGLRAGDHAAGCGGTLMVRQLSDASPSPSAAPNSRDVPGQRRNRPEVWRGKVRQ